jgi:hypothetical protein
VIAETHHDYPARWSLPAAMLPALLLRSGSDHHGLANSSVRSYCYADSQQLDHGRHRPVPHATSVFQKTLQRAFSFAANPPDHPSPHTPLIGNCRGAVRRSPQPVPM